MSTAREPLGPVEYHLISTVETIEGDVVESAPVSTQRHVAISIATWVMNGYLRDRYRIIGNPQKGVWVAFKEGIPGKITLEIREVFNN